MEQKDTPMTVSAICHFHAEPNALPGFIAAAEQMFDEIVLVSSPMDGTPPDPETIAIAEASGHKLIHDTLSQGFGALRTRCIGYGKGDWCFLLDADERVWTAPPVLGVTGTGKFPDTLTPDVHVSTQRGSVNQRDNLRNWITNAEAEKALALCVSRRHWFGAPGEWDRPCQNWNPIGGEADWQLRLVKNSPFVCYDPEIKMHEKIIDTRTWGEPKFLRVSDGSLYIDHYSLHYKNLEPEQNTEDAKIYNELEPGCVDHMWLKHFPKA